MLPIKDIVNKVRMTLKDTDEEQNSYKDEELLMVVNAGIRYIRRCVSKLNPLLLADYNKTITVNAGEFEVDLSSNVSRVLIVKCEGKTLYPANYFEINNYQEKGTPKVYCMVGSSKLAIFPITEVNREIEIVAINDSGELNMTDSTPFNTDLDDLIIEYAVLRCGISDRFSMSQETSLFSNIVSQLQDMCSVETRCIQDGY